MVKRQRVRERLKKKLKSPTVSFKGCFVSELKALITEFTLFAFLNFRMRKKGRIQGRERACWAACLLDYRRKCPRE
jgi:hypothetical protein